MKVKKEILDATAQLPSDRLPTLNPVSETSCLLDDAIAPRELHLRRLGTGDESQHKYRNFLAGVVNAFGSCFDWASCVVCETSIMFDVLVGIQFYRDGHTAWAWIVFGLLCNSSVVFAVIQTNVF